MFVLRSFVLVRYFSVVSVFFVVCLFSVLNSGLVFDKRRHETTPALSSALSDFEINLKLISKSLSAILSATQRKMRPPKNFSKSSSP